MKRDRPSGKASECTSLAVKAATYCAFMAERVSEENQLHGLTEYAAELAAKLDKTTLLGISRELDLWLREATSPSEALLVVARMKAAGVLPNHLPVLPSARRLRHIAESGIVKSDLQASLVRSVLCNPELLALLSGHRSKLEVALEAWEVKWA